MRKIALVNQKGGCGKTTTAINLAACLAENGEKVLLIDMDPQGHSGLALGAKPQVGKSIYEVLLNKILMPDAIQNVKENLDAVFSDVILSAFEQEMSGMPGREYKLKHGTFDIEDYYDYLIIDSPPSISLLTFNSLLAAEELIIPVDSSPFSLEGLGKLLETIQVIGKEAGHKLSIKVLATNIDRRTRFSRYVVETLNTDYPEYRLGSVINTCTRLREAAGQGKPITEYDRHCAGYHDYQDLMKEIIEEEAPMRAEISTSESISEGAISLPQPVEPTAKEILFTLEAPDDAKVQIAGDFNNWIPENLSLIEHEGRRLWQKKFPLGMGSYQYKYVVDGQWIPDPRNDKTVVDYFGDVNSIIDV